MFSSRFVILQLCVFRWVAKCRDTSAHFRRNQNTFSILEFKKTKLKSFQRALSCKKFLLRKVQNHKTKLMYFQVYTDYFVSFKLLVLWHDYLRTAFTVSHITLSAASFLLMAATVERYLQSTADNRTLKLFQILATHRTYVVFCCFLASLIFRGTVFFEIEVRFWEGVKVPFLLIVNIKVVTQPNCTGFSSMGLAVVPMFGESMDVVWRFFIRKIVTVFLPFAGKENIIGKFFKSSLFSVLAYFNAAIVMNVRRTDRDQTVKALVLFITVGTR